MVLVVVLLTSLRWGGGGCWGGGGAGGAAGGAARLVRALVVLALLPLTSPLSPPPAHLPPLTSSLPPPHWRPQGKKAPAIVSIMPVPQTGQNPGHHTRSMSLSTDVYQGPLKYPYM